MGPKTENRAVEARFSRTTCGGARSWIVGGQFGRGNPGFRSWVHAIKRHAREEGLVEPESKPSHWGSVLANDRWGTSVSGRRDLRGVGNVQLNGVGAVIGLICSRG